VDVVIRLDEVFYADLFFLNDEEKKRYEAQRVPGGYSLLEFKQAVQGWLSEKYKGDVQPGNKAIFVKGNGARRNADVLVCAKLRRYYTFLVVGEPVYTDGVCFWPSNVGDRIENFPELHSEELHDQTSRDEWMVEAHRTDIQEPKKRHGRKEDHP
jgi:hypothetical protein